MNENTNLNNCKYCPTVCPRICPCPIFLNIASSIAREEDALACILNAECAKLNKIISEYEDAETLLAVNASVQCTLETITTLERILKEKLDCILPLIHDCL